VQRRYSWRLYLTCEQEMELRRQATMCNNLWNALLEMNNLLREARVWVFTADGPLFFDLAGGLHILRLQDVLERRRAYPRQLHISEIIGQRQRNLINHEIAAKELRTRLPSEYDMGYWISAMRDECAEWRELSTWTPRRVGTSLAAAFQGFFRRAREGAGRSSGYPRFKSGDDIAIPHRCVSGCYLTKSDRHERSWILDVKAVEDSIWARGAVPAEVTEWTDVDIKYRDGHWEASIAVIMKRRRSVGNHPVTVRFDLLDSLAEINGVPVGLPDLARCANLAEELDVLKSDLDTRFPRGDLRAPRRSRLTETEWEQRRELRARISKLSGNIAKIRRNALHVWTARVAREASIITIIAPKVRDVTASPRGDARNWGAAISTVSALNRHVLAQAPALAIQMLKYKAEEAGIRCDVVEDTLPKIGVGADLVTAGKELRRKRRKVASHGSRAGKKEKPPHGISNPSGHGSGVGNSQ
jgi:transposase